MIKIYLGEAMNSVQNISTSALNNICRQRKSSNQPTTQLRERKCSYQRLSVGNQQFSKTLFRTDCPSRSNRYKICLNNGGRIKIKRETCYHHPKRDGIGTATSTKKAKEHIL